MATFETQISKREYKNWIKASLCLGFLKEGLCPFVTSESQALHERVLACVRKSLLGGDDVEGPILHCTLCNTAGIHWNNRTGKWQIRSTDPSSARPVYYCPNYVCHVYIDAIAQEHVSLGPRGMCWDNCVMSTWPDSHWEMSKALLDRQEEGDSKAAPCDCDCSSLLKFVENCKGCHEPGKIDINLATQVRNDRNSIVHSHNMQLSDADLQTITTNMVDLLNSLRDYRSSTETARAIHNIEKTRDTEIEISSIDEVRTLQLVQKEMQKSLIDIKEDHEESKKKMQELETNIKKIQDDLAFLQSHKEIGEDDLEKFKASVLKLYSRLYTQIPLSPLHDTVKVPLDQCFCEVVLVEDFKLKPDARRVIEENREREREVPVKSYHDVFYEGNERLLDIYLLGEAGTGKTVYSRRMVDIWCSVQTEEICSPNSKIPKTGLEQDKALMSEFDYLFYVPLRHVQNSKSLLEAAIDSLKGVPNHAAVVKHLLGNAPDRVLVISDGLDEISGLVDKPKGHLYTVLTTTRPWKFGLVQEKDLQVDRLLKLKGLNESEVSKLITLTLQACFSVHSKATIDTICTDIQKLMVGEIMLNPLIVICLVHLRLQDINIPTTTTGNMVEVVEYLLEKATKKLKETNPCHDCLLRDYRVSLLERSCFPQKINFVTYGHLLLPIAELALDSLVQPNREDSLVFSNETLQKYLSLDIELQTCLELGILSKEESFNSLTRIHEISFPHKLFQEFFSALRIVLYEAAFRQFCEYCNCIEKILEMKHVFEFVCGLSHDTASRLSKHVMEVCSMQPEVTNVRTELFSIHRQLVKSLTDMFIRCTAELQGQDCKLYTADVYIRDPTDWPSTLQLLQMNVETLVTVDVWSETKVSSDNILELVDCLQTVKTLQRFMLRFLEITEPTAEIVGKINKILYKNAELKILELNFGHATPLCGLCLPQLMHLKHLDVHFTATTTLSQQLADVLARGQLRSLYLWSTGTCVLDLDISQLTQLSNLALKCISMSSNAWFNLLLSLSSAPSLQKLQLAENTVSDDSCDSDRIKKIPPAFVERLKLLYLWPKPGDVVSLFVLQHLSMAVNLTERLIIDLSYRGVNADETTRLVTTIPQLQHLQELRLWNIDFQDEYLSLQQNIRLKAVALVEVKMSPTAWTHLFCSMSSLQLAELKCIDIDAAEDSIQHVQGYLAITEKSIDQNGRLTLKCSGRA